MSDFVITRRRTYLLPTRIGWYFGLILIALFAIAIKFSNQPAFIMLFILASLGHTSMLYTNSNMVGIGLTAKPGQPKFLGDTAIFPVMLNNTKAKPRHTLWLMCDAFQYLFSLEKLATKSVDIKLPTTQRGHLNCPDIVLCSQFPVGLLFSWSRRYTPNASCLVYPKPIDRLPLPDPSHATNISDAVSSQTPASFDEYDGLKPYQAGDRLRDIHWPSLAKTHKLATVQYSTPSNAAVSLNWFQLPASMSDEDKLSQLCGWIITAERSGLRYQLEMPELTILFNHGSTHYHECLKVLALW